MAVRCDEDLSVASAYGVEMCGCGTNRALKDCFPVGQVECINRPMGCIHSPYGVASDNWWAGEEIGATPGNREWGVGSEIDVERHDAIGAWNY